MRAVTVGLVLFAAGCQMVMAASADTRVVFAGGPQDVQTILHNAKPAALEEPLVARAALLASSLAAPFAEIRREEPVKIPPGQSAALTWRVEVPDVRVVSRFALTVSTTAHEQLGTWIFFAIPRNLSEQIITLLGGSLFVQTGLHELERTLTAAGASAGSMDAPAPGMRNAILGPWKTNPPGQGRTRIEALAESGMSCIVIGPASLPVPRIVLHRLGKGAAITVSGVDFDNFATNAAAQLALWDAAKLAASPAELPAWIKN
jgi:hypothetical protein